MKTSRSKYMVSDHAGTEKHYEAIGMEAAAYMFHSDMFPPQQQRTTLEWYGEPGMGRYLVRDADQRILARFDVYVL